MGTPVITIGALLLVLGSVCLLTSLPARAEQVNMTVAQVVDVALRNNGHLRSFRDEKGIRDAGIIRAGLLPNPTLDFEAGTGALTGSSGENSVSLGVSQEFLLAGKREKRLNSAAGELEIYRWQLADRERLLAEEVKRTFYDVVLTEQRVSLADRVNQLNRQLFEVTKERLAAGDIPELELNLVKVELARGEGARIDAETALNQNQAKLWTVMGLSPGTSPTVAGAFAPEIGMMKTLTELKQLAHAKRPDLKALEAEIHRGDADIVLARAEGMPNLTAGLALRRDTTSFEVGGMEGKDTGYIIGVKLSLPIPLFDKNQAGVQEAEAKKSSSESRLLAAARNAEREVETAYSRLRHTEKILSLFKVNIIPQMEENLQLTQEAYRLGEVGILAVIQEQRKYFEVSDGYLLALHDRQVALVNLESAVATELTGGAQ